MAPSQQAFSEEKTQLITETMGLWDQFGDRYRTNIATYEELLAEKKALGLIHRGDRIPKGELRDYPDIDFLAASDRIAAEVMLEQMCELGIKQLQHRIYEMHFNYVFRSIESRISAFRYEINHVGVKAIWFDPRRCYKEA